MTLFGYARVSTDGQTLDCQVEALKAAGCETKNIFREKITGAHADRPQLTLLLGAIDDGDVLIVSRLDRLARSTRDLLNILDTLAKRGAAFRSLGDAWADTTTPHGRLMLTVLGGLAEFERELIRARTGEGRHRAKARGVHMGRPPKLTPRQKREALKALATAPRRKPTWRAGSMSARARFRGWPRKRLPWPRPRRQAARRRDGTRGAGFPAAARGPVSRRRAILYGSRARGDHKPDSDADIAVILKGERGDRYQRPPLHRRHGCPCVSRHDGNRRDGAGPALCGRTELARPETFTNPALITTFCAMACILTDAPPPNPTFAKAEPRSDSRASALESATPTALATAPITRCLTPRMRLCLLLASKAHRPNQNSQRACRHIRSAGCAARHMAPEHGEDFNAVQKFPRLADYSGDHVTSENARWAVEQAEAFVAAVKLRFPVA